MTLDPVTLDAAGLAVLLARLKGIADEMGAVLRRAAFSPNIKERADCSAALFTAAGEQLVQAEHIPVHLGAMPASVRAVIDVFRPGSAAGDQVIVNDPFAGGTHLNDVTLVAPATSRRDRRVGGEPGPSRRCRRRRAGSMPADATEIQQEGLRIPPVPWSPALRALILANRRTPDERGGDLDAQVGANVLGTRRLASSSSEVSLSTRCWPTASAECEPRSARSTTARGRSRTCSTRQEKQTISSDRRASWSP